MKNQITPIWMDLKKNQVRPFKGLRGVTSKVIDCLSQLACNQWEFLPIVANILQKQSPSSGNVAMIAPCQIHPLYRTFETR